MNEIDRRSSNRWRVDAHLDDLQAEMEASARTLNHLQREATQAGSVMPTSSAGAMTREICQLRESIAQQRVTLVELRREMTKLREEATRAKRRC